MDDNHQGNRSQLKGQHEKDKLTKMSFQSHKLLAMDPCFVKESTSFQFLVTGTKVRKMLIS